MRQHEKYPRVWIAESDRTIINRKTYENMGDFIVLGRCDSIRNYKEVNKKIIAKYATELEN